ncbi:hypothetical protein N8G13_02920 [Mycoplasma zalophi]|uniref:hypothetical protein n=1 Tax=Mycoplasma zalophi TaxID=191287 RepID=UPI0021C6E7B2|nr:hypothetical protein [Mycoplasma zalophi]MCU4117395.1 hypothetical protein [Mycoplasma zalophi]
MKKHKFFILLLPLSITIPFIAISCAHNNTNAQKAKETIDKANKSELSNENNLQKENKPIITPQKPKTNNTTNLTKQSDKAPKNTQNTQNQTKNTEIKNKPEAPNSNSNLTSTPKINENQSSSNDLSQPQQPRHDLSNESQNKVNNDNSTSGEKLKNLKKQENSTQPANSEIIKENATQPKNSTPDKSENDLKNNVGSGTNTQESPSTPKENATQPKNSTPDKSENDLKNNVGSGTNTQESPNTQKENAKSTNSNNIQKTEPKEPKEPKTEEKQNMETKKEIHDNKSNENNTTQLNTQKGESINGDVDGFQTNEFKIDYIYANAKNLVLRIKGIGSNENFKNYEFYLLATKPGTGFWPIKAIVNAKEDYASVTITKIDSILKHENSENLVITLSYKSKDGKSQIIEWPGHKLIVKGQRIVVEKTN